MSEQWGAMTLADTEGFIDLAKQRPDRNTEYAPSYVIMQHGNDSGWKDVAILVYGPDGKQVATDFRASVMSMAMLDHYRQWVETGHSANEMKATLTMPEARRWAERLMHYTDLETAVAYPLQFRGDPWNLLRITEPKPCSDWLSLPADWAELVQGIG